MQRASASGSVRGQVDLVLRAVRADWTVSSALRPVEVIGEQRLAGAQDTFLAGLARPWDAGPVSARCGAFL
jgi:hypothetical protein